MLGKRIIKIDESGITDISSLGTSTYKWAALEEVAIHEGNVYLFLDTMLAQIIPSSAFKDQNEIEDFVNDIEKIRSH